MSKVADLKLTCEAYPESRLLITEIEGDLLDERTLAKRYTVHAVLEWERNAQSKDYIPLETKVTLHGLTNANDSVTGLVTETRYGGQQQPKLVAVFYL